jgi:TP901 family phage tail tape measure protein
MEGTNLGNIYYTVDADVSALMTAERQISGSVDRVDSRLSELAKAISGVITAGSIAKFLLDASKAAMEFNASISNLSAITGAVGKDLEFLRKTALEFGATTTLSASQAAEALKLVASAKPDLLQSGAALKEVTRQAILLAEAAGIDLAQAAETVGKSLNQFGADASEAARFVNVLAAGSKFGSAEIPAISEALKAAGVAASSAKISFEQTGAAIQVLSAVGLQGSEAGTALRNIFLKLNNDVDKNLRPSVVGLSQALKNVNKLNEDGAAQVKRFGLENIVAAQTLLASTSGLDTLTEKLTGTNTAFDQARTNTDNLAGDMKALESVIEALQIQIGSLADSELRTLTKAFTEFLSAINGNKDALKNWGGIIDGVVKSGEALAVVLAGRLVAASVQYTAAMIQKVSATTSAVIADNNAAKAALRRAEAEKISALALVSSASLDVKAAAGTNAYAFAKANLTKQSAAAAVAVGNYNKAVVLADAANAKAIASTTLLGTAMRGASGVLALLGGPAGAAIIAASAIAYYYATAETADEKTKALAESVNTLADSYKGLNDVQRGIALSKISTEMTAVRGKLLSATNALNNWTETAKTDPFANQKVKQYKNEVETLTQKLNELSAEQQAIFKSGIPEILKTTPELIASTGEAFGASIDKIDSSLDDLRAKLTLTADGYEEYALRKQLAASGASAAAIEANVKELRSLQALRQEVEIMNQVDADSEAQRKKRQERSVTVTAAVTDLASTPLEKLQAELQAQYDLIAEYETLETANHQTALDARAAADAAYLEKVKALTADQGKSFVDMMAENGASLKSFQASAVGAFTAFATGAMSGEEAIRSLAQSILTQMIGALVQMGIQALIGQATATAGAVASGATIATAMAPAAALTSLASFGANAAPAAAGITSTVGLAQGLAIAGGRLYGGYTAPNSMYKVTENGRAEMFSDGRDSFLMTGSRGGSVTPNGDLGGNSQPIINITTINNANNTDVSVQQSTRGNVTDVKFIVDTVASNISSGGKIRGAITQSTTAKNRVV